mmetsp:Transcript_10973/g.16586  ORF Transcript_10973/g.16586 Transcript_10973/m.16586 type:complete len:253 (+) Transcript_10973:835-1593(+)
MLMRVHLFLIVTAFIVHLFILWQRIVMSIACMRSIVAQKKHQRVQLHGARFLINFTFRNRGIHMTMQRFQTLNFLLNPHTMILIINAKALQVAFGQVKQALTVNLMLINEFGEFGVAWMSIAIEVVVHFLKRPLSQLEQGRHTNRVLELFHIAIVGSNRLIHKHLSFDVIRTRFGHRRKQPQKQEVHDNVDGNEGNPLKQQRKHAHITADNTQLKTVDGKDIKQDCDRHKGDNLERSVIWCNPIGAFRKWPS